MNKKNFNLKEFNINDLKNKNTSKFVDKLKVNTKIDNIFDLNVSLVNNKNTSKDSRFSFISNGSFTIGMMSLAPDKLSGYNICKFSDNCKDFCLGHYLSEELEKTQDKKQIIQRVVRTTLFFKDTDKFMEILCQNIFNFIKNNINPVIRLNGYSDIPWERIKFKLSNNIYNSLKEYYSDSLVGEKKTYSENFYNYYSLPKKRIINDNLSRSSSYTIFELFSGVLFYDYTKYSPDQRNHTFENYYLSYSYCNNIIDNIDNFPKEKNLCVIVNENIKEKLLKSKNLYLNFIDGDLYDFRYLDKFIKKSKEKNVGFIVLLKALNSTKLKNKSLNDTKYIVNDDNYKSFIIIMEKIYRNI